LGGFGVYDYVDTVEAKRIKDIHDVTIAFQSQIPDPPKEAEKKVYKMDCGICQTLINKHERKLH
jgi:hypothetical protein